jgi:hypothetical protein
MIATLEIDSDSDARLAEAQPRRMCPEPGGGHADNRLARSDFALAARCFEVLICLLERVDVLRCCSVLLQPGGLCL